MPTSIGLTSPGNDTIYQLVGLVERMVGLGLQLVQSG
jgi:hypothetical protein